ncbi:hypothetical protein CAOG_00847 [Capsaspora owczarzaki ATCC 30864]|uniref:Uncharacterized protein n=1 Tax=Capsaspora owczarzaki (strain ATCC 30864) TaxID=595528 RepID=A0A0D2X0N4_CAPO3|nr:hypothetical protein CAOG_00847 [Capsaspora owczarzaki ATCC 30864]KJE89364.1 hypothetical protein CAOG_000847 [Capsaspora owczarzaki ATCC 30864]|eukprot:XP_004365718.1 hypothetical protein CAOG_00847 [Capsaspora owczarzaki ATCC 30864]
MLLLTRSLGRLATAAVRSPSALPARTMFTEAIPAPPSVNRFGIAKVIAVCALGYAAGATLAHHTTDYLEESEIFVYEDDDD